MDATAYNTGTNRIGTFSYDGRGNVTNMVTRTAVYDAENHQVSVTPAGSSPPTHTYAFDGMGQRVRKTVGSTTTTFVYDAMGSWRRSTAGLPTPAAASSSRTTWAPSSRKDAPDHGRERAAGRLRDHGLPPLRRKARWSLQLANNICDVPGRSRH